MKHLFVVIDNLLIDLDRLPVSINSGDDLKKAEKVLVRIEKSSRILKKLMECTRTGKYLDRVKESSQAKNWAEQIQDAFERMDSLLIVVEKDLKKLRRIAKEAPERWALEFRDTAFGMVKTGIHDEKEELLRLKKTNIYKIDEIREIVKAEEQLDALFG
jgi:hypothetical protein